MASSSFPSSSPRKSIACPGAPLPARISAAISAPPASGAMFCNAIVMSLSPSASKRSVWQRDRMVGNKRSLAWLTSRKYVPTGGSSSDLSSAFAPLRSRSSAESMITARLSASPGRLVSELCKLRIWSTLMLRFSSAEGAASSPSLGASFGKRLITRISG